MSYENAIKPRILCNNLLNHEKIHTYYSVNTYPSHRMNSTFGERVKRVRNRSMIQMIKSNHSLLGCRSSRKLLSQMEKKNYISICDIFT